MTTTSNASRPTRRKARSMPRRRRPKPSAAACWSRMACPKQDAATMAGCLVRADLRGVDTHGLQFLPQYLDRVRRGLVNPKPDLVVERVTPMVGSLDGQNGYGFVVATKAMAAAIDMAREFGVGVVSARSSTHFGMAACYTLQALEAGFISFVFTNASRAMPPWGGREAFLGTSPFAAAAPSGKELPFDLDMSPAVAARGKIRRAARRGEADSARLCARCARPAHHRSERGARWRRRAADRRAERLRHIDADGHHGRRHLGRGLRRRCRQSVPRLRPAAKCRAFLPGHEAGPVHPER